MRQLSRFSMRRPSPLCRLSGYSTLGPLCFHRQLRSAVSMPHPPHPQPSHYHSESTLQAGLSFLKCCHGRSCKDLKAFPSLSTPTQPLLLQCFNWRRKWQLTPVFLSGKSHGQRSLVGYSPWGRKELDTMEHTHSKQGTHVLLDASNFNRALSSFSSSHLSSHLIDKYLLINGCSTFHHVSCPQYCESCQRQPHRCREQKTNALPQKPELLGLNLQIKEGAFVFRSFDTK